MYRLPILTAIVLISFSSCKKKNTTPAFNDLPIVEAYLNSGDHMFVKISHQTAVSTNVTYTQSIDSLDLIITVDGIAHHLQHTGEGMYEDSSLQIREGADYDLQFMYNSKEISASTTIPTKPTGFIQSATSMTLQHIDATTTFEPGSFTMPDPITLDWDNADASYYLVVVQNTESNPQLIRDTIDDRPSPVFRSTPAIINSTTLREQQFQYYGHHLLILYHINPDYASLYDNTNNTSQNLSTPETGIINGLGIFTGISADTLELMIYKK